MSFGRFAILFSLLMVATCSRADSCPVDQLLTNFLPRTITSGSVVNGNYPICNDADFTLEGGATLKDVHMFDNVTSGRSQINGRFDLVSGGPGITNSGEFRVGYGGSISPEVRIQNSGLMENRGSIWLAGGYGSGFVANLENSGTFLNYGGINTAYSANITNTEKFVNNGGIYLNDANLTSNGQFTGSGVLEVNSSIDGRRPTVGLYGTFEQRSLTVGDGNVAGNAVVRANVVLTNTLGSPLSSSRTLGANYSSKLAIDGSLDVTGASSGISYEVSGAGAAGLSALDVSGNATFQGGTLRLHFAGYVPKNGDSWIVLTAGSIAGQDSLAISVDGLAECDCGFSLLTSADGKSLMVSVPEPSTIILLLGGSALLLVRRKYSRCSNFSTSGRLTGRA